MFPQDIAVPRLNASLQTISYDLFIIVFIYRLCFVVVVDPRFTILIKPVDYTAPCHTLVLVFLCPVLLRQHFFTNTIEIHFNRFDKPCVCGIHGFDKEKL